ncbi:MAG TPA: GNAT family N-acetyltransferase [Stellaceae bacterium]|jgi:ribosomal-protein-alanine N-acetyltransferase|nr:GNAT family N-acetyltransferase [Stellaceae bacterium]
MNRSRTVAASDAAVIAALHGECFPDDPWGEQSANEVLAMPGAFGFLAVAEDGATPTGFLIALAVAGSCEILALGVRPAWRRRGIAGALLNRLLAAVAGVTPVVLLEVAEDNDAALALYSEAGFARVGRRPAYYRRADGARVAALQLRRCEAQTPAF